VRYTEEGGQGKLERETGKKNNGCRKNQKNGGKNSRPEKKKGTTWKVAMKKKKRSGGEREKKKGNGFTRETGMSRRSGGGPSKGRVLELGDGAKAPAQDDKFQRRNGKRMWREREEWGKANNLG